MPEKFIALTRTSTRRQQANGRSKENQLDAIKRFVKERNGIIVQEFNLTQSGAAMKLNRGALLEVLRAAEDHQAAICINTIDRLSRDALSLHLLKEAATENKVSVWIASLNMNLTAMDALTFGAITTMAEAERMQTAARIKNSKFKSKGAFGTLVNAKEAAAASATKRKDNFLQWAETIDLVGKIKTAASQMAMPTLQNTAIYLNGLQSVTITGKPWTYGNLHSVIRQLGYKNLDELVWKQIEEHDIKEEAKAFSSHLQKSSLAKAVERGTFLE